MAIIKVRNPINVELQDSDGGKVGVGGGEGGKERLYVTTGESAVLDRIEVLLTKILHQLESMG